jgi:8-oxo-dGTP pyrophosphatase MutT (NUDIX family)
VSGDARRASIARVAEVIRRAASVIVARPSDGGFDVLVLERGASSRFLPSYVAFPGGSVEPGDADIAERWFGSREEDARACAVRELVEEVALAVTGEGLEEAPARGFERVDADPPSAALLPEIAHWIAPEDVPVRFDARYFALEAPHGVEPRHDGVETAGAWWISPGTLLEEMYAGRRKLYWPTFFTVSAIAPCERVDDLLALRLETREPTEEDVERLPRSVFWQD